MKKEFKLDFRGRTITVETGELAKQANGAVLVRYGDTVVLSCSVMSSNVSTADFFPLTVLYQEKLYSVGKIPGGFIKREGRPTEEATLASRLIDRPIRPMFADGFRNEVQVINTVLSVDPDNSPEMTAMLGASLSLSISDIPFDGPIAGVRVGKIGEEYIINPTVEETEESELILTLAGTKDDICMIEAGAKQVSEDVMIKAIEFGQKAIRELCVFEYEIMEAVGRAKVTVDLKAIDPELTVIVKDYARDMLLEVMRNAKAPKEERNAGIENVKVQTIGHFSEVYAEKEDLADILKDVRTLVDELEAELVRDLIVDEHIRPDGRALDEIRPLSADIDILPRTHGSALFTRGQTQALSTTTLGAIGEHQILDGLGIEDMKRFMLHYNFPNYSVGETGRYGAPGRREIGHGALGERALLQVMPTEEEFPYTVRVVSEILESNGSSSQASICAGCLSLMAAGVPIKAPVAGIAMGLITKGDKHAVLTDIQGLEDHMGDMDFKVAGTKDGITALQMDIKIKGITEDILKEALAQAHKARQEILALMTSIIPLPRKELSPYAPKISMINIKPEKIKDVIGRGGEMITKIILECSNVKSVNDKDAVKVDIDDDGHVVVYHTDQAIIDKTIEMIESVVREVEEDIVYTGKVTKVEDFGVFVELWPNCEGLVHVSQLAHERVGKPSDIVKVGDEIMVKSLGYDNRGRLNLSRKEALPKPKKVEKTKDKEAESKEKDTIE